jgi:hypothetical protein
MFHSCFVAPAHDSNGFEFAATETWFFRLEVLLKKINFEVGILACYGNGAFAAAACRRNMIPDIRIRCCARLQVLLTPQNAINIKQHNRMINACDFTESKL